MKEMTNITKLPKWAQEHIGDVERQRDVAIKTLNDFVDNQTPSAIFYEDSPCTGEKTSPVTKRKYLQTCRIEIEWQGVYFSALLRNDHIDCQYGAAKKYSPMVDVAFIPQSYQSFRLVSKENMYPKEQK